MNLDNVSILITNTNGEKILPLCIQQIRKCYPTIKIRVANDKYLVCFEQGRDSVINLNDKSEEVCNRYNIECINIDHDEFLYKFEKNIIDYNVQYCWDKLNEDYVILIDNDTLFIQPGIIEFSIGMFNFNKNLAAIGEILKDGHPFNVNRYYKGTKIKCNDDDLRNGKIKNDDLYCEDRIPRISNWMTILNMKLLHEKNITYGDNSLESAITTNKYSKKYNEDFNTVASFDGYKIFLKCFYNNLDILDLYSYFSYSYKNKLIIPIEHDFYFICNYYCHLGGFMHSKIEIQEKKIKTFFEINNYILKNK